MTLKGLLVAFFGCMLTVGYAQNCTQKLNTAEDDYEEGRLLGIPDLINSCLEEGGFSKEEEVRARKLLTLVHIFTDNELKAESSLIGLLKAEPEYQLNPQVDPSELTFLYNQFRTEPIFRIGFRVGMNATFINVLETHSTSNLNQGFYKFYNGEDPANGELRVQEIDNNGEIETTELNANSGRTLGLFGEITFERYIGKGFELGLGGQFRTSTYNVDQYINNQGLQTQVAHNQTYVRTPFFVRYNLFYDKKGRIIPYVVLGASADFLLSARYSDAVRNGGTAYTLPENLNDLKSTGLVNDFNYSFFGGIGAKVKVKTHFLSLEIKYDNSMLNYINGDNRYISNSKVTFDQGFVEDDLTINYVSFSLGYIRSLYKPQKRKEFR